MGVLKVVRGEGLEPSSLFGAVDFESTTSASSVTRAYLVALYTGRHG